MRAATLVLLGTSAVTGQLTETGACAHDSNGDGIVGVDGEPNASSLRSSQSKA